MLSFDPSFAGTTLAPEHWVADDSTITVIDFSFKWWEFYATANDLHKIDPGYIDYFYGNFANNIFIGDQWSDTMFGGAGDDHLQGRGGDDELHGGGDTDFIFGQDGDDLIYGGDGDDSLYGGDDDDEFYGGKGDDKQYGGAGKDEFNGSEGADLLDGGNGKDIVWYTDSTAGVNVNLATGTVSGGYATGDTLVNIEMVAGSEFDDVLTGGAKDDFLAGWGGTDTINGGAGNDNIHGGENGAAGGDQLWGGAGNDTFHFTNTGSGGVAKSIDTIWDFDQNGDDHLVIHVNDTYWAKHSYSVLEGKFSGKDGVLVIIEDRDDQNNIARTQEIFLAGATNNDIGVDDFSFYPI